MLYEASGRDLELRRHTERHLNATLRRPFGPLDAHVEDSDSAVLRDSRAELSVIVASPPMDDRVTLFLAVPADIPTHTRARAPTFWPVVPAEVDPADARHELARRYIHVCGPATAEGFARWAGISRPSATDAFASLDGGSSAPVRRYQRRPPPRAAESD